MQARSGAFAPGKMSQLPPMRAKTVRCVKFSGDRLAPRHRPADNARSIKCTITVIRTCQLLGHTLHARPRKAHHRVGPSMKAKPSGEVLMRIILFLAAAFITCVTALPVFAQSPDAPPVSSNQRYVQTNGKWMVCVGLECKPLSKKACNDFYTVRSTYLAELSVQLQGVDRCGPVATSVIQGVINDVLNENTYRQQACLTFAEEQNSVSARQPAKRPARSSASSPSRTSEKSSLSAPAIVPAGLLETGPYSVQQGPAATGKPPGPTQTSPAFRSK